MESQRIKILLGKPERGQAQVFIDDKEITNISSIQISDLLPFEIPVITLTIRSFDVEIEGDVKVVKDSLNVKKLMETV